MKILSGGLAEGQSRGPTSVTSRPDLMLLSSKTLVMPATCGDRYSFTVRPGSYLKTGMRSELIRSRREAAATSGSREESGSSPRKAE